MAAWNPKANEIFVNAIELSAPDDRRTLLDRECGVDVGLREQVEKLLQAHDSANSFLQQPAPGCAPTVVPEKPANDVIGSRIGSYKLLQEIGAGGMGTVFMAEQTAPVKRMVALKVIKPGMDTAQVVARFEAERQALALMDHPNIAKVLDAGTTDAGRPYFVMELVKGVPITKYCDEHQLTPRERMELFVPVCQAIQHAHQKGIIHRDIKPSNVMIANYDGRPMPKVIDFGVAKAMGQQLTERTMFTGFGGIVGTLEYMSPEQAEFNALDVDTRSDIYSLGVLLYELLTGSTPLTKQQLKQAAITEVLRIIREQEPPKPSTRLSDSRDSLAALSAQRKLDPVKLTKEVSGELDWIVMKALEKDRTRRYETANGLARDIERFLHDEQVEACPPTLGYRFRKVVRRHRRTAIVSAVFALLVVTMLANHFVGYFQLKEARGRAVVEFNRAQIAAAEAKEERDRAKGAELQARNAEEQALAEKQKAEQAAKDEAVARAAAVEERNEATVQRNIAREQETLAKQSRDEAQQNLVTSHFLLGKIANSAGDTAGALTWYLRAYRDAPLDDPRRASARNLIGAWGGNLKQTLVHDSGVHTVAISADGRKLVSGYYHSRAQIWDLATGMPQGAPLPHGGDIVSAQLSADGGFVLIGDWSGAKVWDVATGQLRYPMLEHAVREDTVVSPVLSPDGRSIVTRSPFTGIRLWDAETGKPRGESLPVGRFVRQMFFAPDSKRVAALGGGVAQAFVAMGAGVAQVWDVEKAQPVGEAFTEVTDLAFHPAGQVVAVCRNDGKLVLRDLDSGKQIAELAHDKPLHSVEFDADGTNLVCHDGENAYLWLNVLKDERKRSVMPHGRGLFAATFSPVGGSLLTASSVLLRVWKQGAAAIAPVWERGVPPTVNRRRSDRIKSASFSPDGKSLLTMTENDTAEVSSVATGQMLVRELNVLPRAATFTADGKSVVVGSRDGWVRVRSVNTSDGRRLPKTVPSTMCSGGVAALSPDGKLIFVVGREKFSHICRTDTGEPVGKPLEGLYHDYKDSVAGAAFSPDNRVLITSMSFRGKVAFGPPDGQIAFWDVATTSRIGEPISVASTGEVAFDPTGRNVRVGLFVLDVPMRSVRTFAPDRLPKGHRTVTQLLPYSDSSPPLLWDDERGTPKTVNVPDENAKQALLSPDGRRLLIVRNDGSARLLDAAAGTPVGPAFQPEGSATERTRDGRYTLFGTLTTLRLWDTSLGRPCGEPLQNEQAHATATFGPCGTVVATNWSFSARLWDCATGQALGPPMELPSNTSSQPIFSADGRRLYIPASGLEVWRVHAPAADEPERLRLSIEVRTGLEVNDNATIQKLSQSNWLERKRRLEQLGGPSDVGE